MNEPSPDDWIDDRRLAALHEALLHGEPRPQAESEQLAAAERCLLLFERVRRQAESRQSGWLFDTNGGIAQQRPHSLEAAALAALAEVSGDGPRKIGRFLIQRRVGEGGFGIVFLALDPDLNRQVALKLPRPETLLSPSWRDRFLREAEAAAALDHPGIVPVYEVGRAGTLCYIVQAWCEGPSLDRWLAATKGGIPPPVAAELCAALADAVQHAHSRGVLHRDIKPSNIMLESLAGAVAPSPATLRARSGADTADLQADATVDETSKSRRAPASGPAESAAKVTMDQLARAARLTDFGLAQLADRHDQTRTGAILGTPSYMAPEQAEGKTREIGIACDVYSLGAVLYELLTGRPPFREDSLLATLQAVREREPPGPRLQNAKIPRDLEAICLKCLEKDPRRRYATARELEDDLRRFLRGDVVLARQVGSVQRWARWSRRNPLLAGLALAMTALLLGVSVISTLAAVRLEHQRQALATSLTRTSAAERAAANSDRFARQRLYESLRAQATAEQVSGRDGQRLQSLEAIAEAARLARELKLDSGEFLALRNAAIRSLDLADLELDVRWPVEGKGVLASAAAFDPELQHYALAAPNEAAVTVHRLGDNVAVRKYSAGSGRLSTAAVQFGPRGKHLALQCAVGNSARIVVWNLASGDTVFTTNVEFRIPGEMLMFSFSPNEDLIAAAAPDDSIGVYELPTGKEVCRLPATGSVSALAFRPDGKTLAVSRDGRVSLVEVPSAKVADSVSLAAHWLSWSSDGVRLAMATQSYAAVWKAGTRERPVVLSEPHGRIASIVFGPDDTLATSTYYGAARLWDAHTGRELVATTGRPVRFSQDGSFLGVLNYGPSIERWHVRPAREHLVAASDRLQHIIHVDAADGWLITRSSGTHLWDLQSLRQVGFLVKEGGGFWAVESRSGELAAWRKSTTGELFRHPLKFRRLAEARQLELHPPIRATTDGSESDISGPVLDLGDELQVAVQAAAARPFLLFGGVNDGGLSPLPPLYNLQRAALAPRARLVASIDRAGGLRVTNVDTEQTEWRLSAPPQDGYAGVAFSPNEQLLAVSSGRAAEFFTVGPWRRHARIELPADAADRIQVAFSAGGKLVACQIHDHVVQLLDAARMGELLRVEIDRGDSVVSLAFSDDDSRLVAGTRDGKLHVWHLDLIRQALAPLGLDWGGEPPVRPHTREAEAKPLVVRYFVPKRPASTP